MLYEYISDHYEDILTPEPVTYPNIFDANVTQELSVEERAKISYDALIDGFMDYIRNLESITPGQASDAVRDALLAKSGYDYHDSASLKSLFDLWDARKIEKDAFLRMLVDGTHIAG